MQIVVASEIDLVKLGVYCAELRLKFNISVRDLHLNYGLQNRSVERIEKGMSVNTKTLLKYCNALGITINFMV